jgi:hypothetical protein
MNEIEFTHWESMNGGNTLIELPSGQYRLEGGTTVARLIPGSVPYLVGNPSDGLPEMRQDTPDRYVSVAAPNEGWTVGDPAKFQITWPRGRIILWKIE